MNTLTIIENDWKNDRNVRGACLNIWRKLASTESHLDHYTFNDLQDFSEENDCSMVSKAITYLSNPNLKILNICLMYESSDGGFFELPSEEVNAYLRGEKMIHPDYGYPIDDTEILICFTVGTGVQKGIIL